VPSSAATYWARWTANTYNISYNTNGGIPANITAQTKTHGDDLRLSGTRVALIGHNYLFYTSSHNGAHYQPGDFYRTDAPTILTAQWSPVFYTITYDANVPAGVTVTNMPTNQMKRHGRDLILLNTVPVRPGHSFMGWSENRNATTPTYPVGMPNRYTADANVRLFAVWRQTGYTISYNANVPAGITVTNMPTSQLKFHGTDLTLRSNTPVHSMGFTFLGWSTNRNATTATFRADGTYTADAPAALFAVWRLPTLTVNHYLDEGYVIRFTRPDLTAQNKVIGHQQVVSNVLRDLFHLRVNPSVDDTFRSIADVCRGNNLTGDCTHTPPHVLTRNAFRDDLIEQFTPGGPMLFRSGWTGHILDDNPVSAYNFANHIIMMMPRHTTNSTTFVNQSEAIINRRSRGTLLHEIAHGLSAPDHYCYGNANDNGPANPCRNPTRDCWRCDLDLDENDIPNCVMTTSNIDLATVTVTDIFCDRCAGPNGFIRTYIRANN
jgi:hypothetical protein